jgi:hypothetical protein
MVVNKELFVEKSRNWDPLHWKYTQLSHKFEKKNMADFCIYCMIFKVQGILVGKACLNVKN